MNGALNPSIISITQPSPNINQGVPGGIGPNAQNNPSIIVPMQPGFNNQPNQPPQHHHNMPHQQNMNMNNPQMQSQQPHHIHSQNFQNRMPFQPRFPHQGMAQGMNMQQMMQQQQQKKMGQIDVIGSDSNTRRMMQHQPGFMDNDQSHPISMIGGGNTL